MNWKWVVRFVLLVLLALNMVACRCGAPSPSGAADLSAERTRVQFRHPGEAVEEVRSGQSKPVGTGDQINTDNYGVGILRFSAFLRVKVFRQTELQVKAAPDPNASPIVKLYLALGTTLQELQSQVAQAVDVTTDTDWATIRATATEYLVSVDGDGITWVVGFDGEVEVAAQGQIVVVRAGRATWVEPGQTPRSPIDVDMEAVERWLEDLGGAGGVGPLREAIQPPEEEGDLANPWLKVWHSPPEPNEEQVVTVVAEAGDDDSGLARIEIQMPGQRLVTCWESYCEATGGPYSKGEFDYEVGAFDEAGNAVYQEGHFAVAAFDVQDAPPVMGGVYVEPSTLQYGEEFRITLVASDDTGLQSIGWQMNGTGDEYLDSGDEADCGASTWCERSWTLKWTGEDGQFTVYAQARDTTGQLSSTDSAMITVLSSAAARFSLLIGGGPLNDESVQKALGFAVDWAAFRDGIGEVVLVDFFSGATLAGPTAPAHDPEQARAILEEVGYYGFDTTLLFDPGDELAAKLAEWVASYLYEVEIYPESVGVNSADGRARLAIMIEAGESGLLIERR